VSAEDGIGTAGRLQAVDELPEEGKQRLGWPKGRVPFPSVKKGPKSAQNGLNWREIVSNLSELAGIGSASYGAWLWHPSAGFITGGVGLMLVGLSLTLRPERDVKG
jgi:hypothetical protein